MIRFHSAPLGVCVLLAATVCVTPGRTPAADTVQVATNAEAAPATLAITHGPFLQAPSGTSITVSWATSLKCVSQVEYRAEASVQWLTNIPSHYGLVDADVTRHNVTLTGLAPGTAYRYRLVSREIIEFKPYKVTYGSTIASPEYRFTTLDLRKPGFSFVAVNDRHENVSPLATSLASVNWSNVDLVFLNGDMVNAVQDEAQLYRCVVDACVQSFASRLPFVYVRGNHDTRGSFARRLQDYFPTTSGRYYYTLYHGPVAFLILDGGEDKPDDSGEYSGLVDFEPYLRQELEWLAREIETPAFQQARFRVGLLHIPPAPRPDPKFIRPQWLLEHVVPLLNRGKLDLLITGHTHRYAVRPAGQDGMDFPVITGGILTVIRCDVAHDEIRVTGSDLAGNSLPQLPPIKPRARD